MSIKALAVGLALSLGAADAFAAPAANNESPAASSSPEARVDAFFGALKDGKVTQAYNDVFASALMSKKQADLEVLAGQTEAALRFYGAVVDWEMVKEERVSEHFLLRTYMLRTAEVPVFFKFQFYNNGKRWVVANVFMTDTYAKVRD